MTVLCAVQSPETKDIYYASDTQGTRNGLRIDVGSKWVPVGDRWLIGFTGTHRTQNLVEWKRDKLMADTVVTYLDFIGELRSIMKEDGYERHSDQNSLDYGQGFIVLEKQKGIYVTGSDFSIIPLEAGHVWAEGCGRDYALGAYYGISDVQRTALHYESTLRTCIEAAIKYDTGCGGRIITGKL